PPAGSFNPLRFRLQLSRSRCRVPHLLLHFPCAVPFTVQHQRHFSVALDRWLSIRRLHHLMLRRPFRCPFPTHLNVVKFHLLLHHLVPRHFCQNVFHPLRNLLPSNHGRIARHQIDPILRP